MRRLTREAALVDADLKAIAEAGDGAMYEAPDGNRYVCFTGVTSVKDAVFEHMMPWLIAHAEDFKATADRPWELDDDQAAWFWLAFKDLVAYDDTAHVAGVCLNMI